MNSVTDPAKKSHEAKGINKKRETHAPTVKDDKVPEPKPASNADDRLTPEEVERDYQFFDPSKVPDSCFALAVAPRRNGKSEMLQSLLEEFHKDKVKKFDYVFLWRRWRRRCQSTPRRTGPLVQEGREPVQPSDGHDLVLPARRDELVQAARRVRAQAATAERDEAVPDTRPTRARGYAQAARAPTAYYPARFRDAVQAEIVQRTYGCVRRK